VSASSPPQEQKSEAVKIWTNQRENAFLPLQVRKIVTNLISHFAHFQRGLLVLEPSLCVCYIGDRFALACNPVLTALLA
jgi:hypothetical protein